MKWHFLLKPSYYSRKPSFYRSFTFPWVNSDKYGFKLVYIYLPNMYICSEHLVKQVLLPTLTVLAYFWPGNDNVAPWAELLKNAQTSLALMRLEFSATLWKNANILDDFKFFWAILSFFFLKSHLKQVKASADVIRLVKTWWICLFSSFFLRRLWGLFGVNYKKRLTGQSSGKISVICSFKESWVVLLRFVSWRGASDG